MRSRRLLVMAVILVITLLGAWLAWLRLRGPLAGDKTHDFGTIIVAVEGLTLRHTFTLTNRTSHEIVVSRVSSTCGCAGATLSTERIQPGGRVEVAVDFNIQAWARKHANINLELGDEDGVVTLTVAATGTKDG